MKHSVVVLHGALGSAKQLELITAALSKNFNVYSFNFSGHGGKPIDGLYSIQLFSTDLSQFLEDYKLENVFIFGYSMGGYVALNLASTDKRISKIFTLGTKFNWSPETSEHEVKMLNPDKIEEKVPLFAKTLEVRHAPQDWKLVLKNTAEMMTALGKHPELTITKLKTIRIPVTISLGSEDKMVSLEESKEVADALPKAKFTLYEGFKHPIEQVDIQILADDLTNFFLKES